MKRTSLPLQALMIYIGATQALRNASCEAFSGPWLLRQ